MSDESSASKIFPTIDESELKRILEEKDSKNTRRATNGAAKSFRSYLKARNAAENIEQLTGEEFDEHLGKFYVEVRQENGERYQKTSFYSLRYGIHRHMSLVKNVDIINNPAFQVSQKIFVAVAKFIKRDDKGAFAHYPPIEENDLTKMYEYFDNTSDNVKLQQNVIVDIMLYFGRQGREKIHELKVTDFPATTDSEGKVYLYLRKDEQTKNHQDDPNSAKGRMYARTDDPFCPVKSFMKYKGHLNPKCNILFQRPSKAENARYWYSNVPLCHNSIGEMMPAISTNAGLSQRYANHSLRATTVHILDSNKFSGRHVTSITGHESESSLKTYTGYTAPNIKRKMSETISNTWETRKTVKH